MAQVAVCVCVCVCVNECDCVIVGVNVCVIVCVCVCVCLSVHMEQLCSHWMDFHEIWYLIIYPKMCRQVSLKPAKHNGTSHQDQYTFITICLNSSQNEKCCRQKAVDKITTHILCSIIFAPKSCRLWDVVGKIWYSQTDRRWQYDTAHALCMLDNWGYRHRLRICNNNNNNNNIVKPA